MLVSSRDSPPALAPVRIKPFLSRATTSPSPVGAGQRAEGEEEEEEREGQALTAPECDRLALAYETSVYVHCLS